MRPFKKAAIAGATAAAILLSPFMSGAASAQPKQGFGPSFPGVNCATSGPAKSYDSATNTQRRNCWWGYEYLYSKKHGKLIAACTINPEQS